MRWNKTVKANKWADMIKGNVEHVNQMRLANRVGLVSLEIGTLFLVSVWSLIFLVSLF